MKVGIGMSMDERIGKDSRRRLSFTELLQWAMILFVTLRVFFPLFMERCLTFVPVLAGVMGVFLASVLNKRYISGRDQIYYAAAVLWWLWCSVCFRFGGEDVPRIYATMLPAITLAFLCAMPIAQTKISGWSMAVILSICISVIATVWISAPFIQENAYLVREMATGKNVNTGLGIGGYEFSYCIALLTPCLLFAVDAAKGWKRCIAILTIVAVCIYSVICALFTTLLIVSASVLLYLVSKVKRRRSRIILFAVLIVLMLLMAIIGAESVIFVLERIEALFENEVLSAKLNDIIIALRGGDEKYNTLSSRTSRYMISIMTFAVSPIVGGVPVGAGGTSGGHSMLLDYLAISGLLGTSLFFGLVLGIYRTVRRTLHCKQAKSVYMESMIIYLVVALLKGAHYLTITWTMMVVVPMMVRYLDASMHASVRCTNADITD